MDKIKYLASLRSAIIASGKSEKYSIVCCNYASSLLNSNLPRFITMANTIWKEVFLIMCSSSRKNARNTERFSLSLRITDDYALSTSPIGSSKG